MKILNRLRDLLAQPGHAAEEPIATPSAPVIDRDEIDFDDNFYDLGDGGLLNADANHCTVDGLRRRIPELHEDFPPDALHMDSRQDETT